MKVRFCSLALALLLFAPLVHSDPVDNWVEMPKPSGLTGGLTSVAYGKVSTVLGTVGVFVAVGENGIILTSTDGANWTAQNSGVSSTFRRVKFVNDRFFALGGFPPSLVSVDGVSWSNIGPALDITYMNGSYFRISYAPASFVWRSTDLLNWTQTTSSYQFFSEPTYEPPLLEAFNGVLVAVGNSQIALSKDGVTWTPGAFLFGNALDVGITASVQNNLFFRGGTTSTGSPFFLPEPGAFYSNDLINWPVAAPGNPPFPRDGAKGYSRVAAGGPNYVMLMQGTVFHTTHLASNWVAVGLPGGGSFNYVSDVTYGAPYFVAIADRRIFRSDPIEGAVAPQIHKQPVSFAATVGSTATLTVGAQGTQPITYQWRKDGASLAGATNSVLTLNNFTFSDAGDYDVLVSNAGGTIQSDKASIGVNFAEVHTYSGVTLRGSPGDKFLIESRDTLDPLAPWQSVTNVSLTDTKYLWIDLQSPDQPKRYFRATYQGR